jgi:putative transposase
MSHIAVTTETSAPTPNRPLSLASGIGRRKRTGAFWSDRYHATAIDRHGYLWKCMLYINLNMVRTGVVEHPLQWFPSGYAEILSPKKRYGLLSWQDLLDLLGMESVNDLQKQSTLQITEALERDVGSRDANWSESIAVGNIEFLQNIQSQLGYRIKGREIRTTDNIMHIREPQLAIDLHIQGPALIGDNSKQWNAYDALC